MKKKLISLFNKYHGKSLKITDIADKLDILSDHEYSALKAMLFDLVEENFLTKVGKRYKLNNRIENKLIGTISLTEAGYGFVVFKDSGLKDVFIAARHLGTAFNGDQVEVSLFAKQKGKNLEGQVINIVKRAREEFVGTLEKSKSFYFIKPDESNIHRDIYIAPEDVDGAKPGDKVVVNCIEWKSPLLNPEGKIKEILGKAGSYDTEIAALAREFNLPYSFSKSVLKETEKIPAELQDKELAKRLDLREKTIFTIDPEDAKDFDDAVSIEPLENGNFLVGVHIADVSHYVKPNTPLDNEASNRGNSVYFVGKVIPMLPEKLSNGICSLKPLEDRLTYSVIAELTPRGRIVNYEIKKTVINSKRRFTYEEAQEVINSGKGDFVEELTRLNNLAKVLRKKRMSTGSINFITPEVKFKLDENGVPVDITKKVVVESHMLIEEYMLLANQIVASHIGASRKKETPPFIYRVHDQPDQAKVLEFANFVKSLGYSFNPTTGNKPKEFQRLLNSVKDTEEEALINEIAIRSMAKAVYSANNIGHYGLGFKYYSHFTSPIRRYPDLIAHRLLFHYIDNAEGLGYEYDELEEICEHTSATERSAVSAERLSVKLKQIEYLKSHIGEEFSGVISGVTHFGIFIELTQNLAEGLIRLRDLDDDFYEFDEKKYSIIGRRTHKRYRLGDKVTVRLIRVDEDRRGLDFIITSDNN